MPDAMRLELGWNAGSVHDLAHAFGQPVLACRLPFRGDEQASLVCSFGPALEQLGKHAVNAAQVRPPPDFLRGEFELLGLFEEGGEFHRVMLVVHLDRGWTYLRLSY